MDLKIDNETPEQTILRVLGEGDATQPLTLYRLVADAGQHTPRAISNALLTLGRQGLVEQSPGGRGVYRLTTAGLEAIGVRKPDFFDLIVAHPGAEALDLTTGRLAIGVGEDGKDVTIPLWGWIGTRMLLASGVTGAGTTNVLAGTIEAAIPNAPYVRTWIVDTSRQLAEYHSRVDRVSRDAKASIELLNDVLRVQEDRSGILARAGRRSWSGPLDAVGMPLGLLVISALDGYETPGFHNRLSAVLAMARKTGIVVAADVPNLSLECVHSYQNRETFLAGTVLRMRSFGPIDGDVGNKAKVHFPDIPATFKDGSTTAGLGYLADGQLIRAFWTSGL